MPPPANVLIRAASISDAPAIAHVHVSSWLTTYRGIVPDGYLDSRDLQRSIARWQEILRDDPAKGWFTIVAEESGQIVGFASAGPIRTDDPGYTGELGGIYLLQSRQRRGIGRLLVADVARCLRERGMDSMFVWVLRDNPSRAFYEVLGGAYVREQPITIGGAELIEVAYGWTDISVLL